MASLEDTEGGLFNLRAIVQRKMQNFFLKEPEKDVAQVTNYKALAFLLGSFS